MPISTVAIYRDGVLEPVDDLRLRGNERVTLTITQGREEQPSPDDLDQQVRAWLPQQKSCPEQLPMEVSREERERLDAELDEIIEELHRGSRGVTEGEVARDAEEALRAAREA